MEILCTFEDSTTELRATDCPCVSAPMFVSDMEPQHPSEERWYLWFQDERFPLSFCGLTVRTLAFWRGGTAYVWRMTGQNPVTKAITGDWQSCHVESVNEQIARLTQERDEARDVARRLAALDFNEPPSLYDAAQVQAWGGPQR